MGGQGVQVRAQATAASWACEDGPQTLRETPRQAHMVGHVEIAVHGPTDMLNMPVWQADFTVRRQIWAAAKGVTLRFRVGDVTLNGNPSAEALRRAFWRTLS